MRTHITDITDSPCCRAGARAVDLGGPRVYQWGRQSLKLSTNAAVFKRESLLIGGATHVGWGGQVPLGAGPALLQLFCAWI